MLSPAATSPFVPSSYIACVAEPPRPLRSIATARPVLGGLLPGVTVTVRSVSLAEYTGFGVAAATPAGFVGHVEELILKYRSVVLPVAADVLTTSQPVALKVEK